MAKHQLYELRQKQSLPLEMKIVMTQQRIKEWYDYWGGNIYVSFSGGKDSTVLADIVKKTPGVYDVPLVFIDTGLEYPEIRRFVLNMKYNGDNVEIIKPEMKFREVVDKYGYPAISKEVSRRLQYAKKAISEGRESTHRDYLKLIGKYYDKNGEKSRYNCDKYGYLLDIPVNFSAECCTVMKKRPAKQYGKSTGRKPMVASMAEESQLRTESWLRNGCNAFESDNSRSMPMAFWTEQDVLQYLKTYKVPYCSVYGDIIAESASDQVRYLRRNGVSEDQIYRISEGDVEVLKTTGCSRTGCYACMFGCHLEKPENRFQKLAESHPKLYHYCIDGGEFIDGLWKPNKLGLGLGKVLDYIGVDYRPVHKSKRMKLF